jgi:hypothetical protein
MRALDAVSHAANVFVLCGFSSREQTPSWFETKGQVRVRDVLVCSKDTRIVTLELVELVLLRRLHNTRRALPSALAPPRCTYHTSLTALSPHCTLLSYHPQQRELSPAPRG